MIKSLITVVSVIALSGCMVAMPVHGTRVEPYPTVVQPSIEYVYVYDNRRSRYYRDDRGNRVYMPPRWEPPRHRGRGHDHRHRHR